MKLLVTAGNTAAPVDRVRVLTNVFTGRTGAAIAAEAVRRGHTVTLLTSHPPAEPLTTVQTYRTFADLAAALEHAVRVDPLDAIIHSAAVSDYLCAGVYAAAADCRFDTALGTWIGSPVTLHDCSAGKVKSDHPELWLRLTRAPKLIDHIRAWGFRGVLVKFKLEVGTTEAELLSVAEKSRQHSRADLMVANTLEGSHDYAFLGPLSDGYQRIARADLPRLLCRAVEDCHGGRRDG